MNDRSTFLHARDPDTGVEFTSPYAFVPLVKPLPSPFGDDVPSHARPEKDGACGHIDVEWVFERPALVGGSDPRDGWATFAEDARGVPILPGGTTRGLIRSLLEIATGSRMDHYDHDAHFAVRDSEDKRIWKEAMPSATDRAFSFGWLRPADPGRIPSAHNFDGWVIELVERAHQLETSSVVPDVAQFEKKNVAGKMAELVALKRLHISATTESKPEPKPVEEKQKAVFNPRGTISGWVVVTGVDPAREMATTTARADTKGPKAKKYATLFVDQPGLRVFPVPPEVMRRFVKTHNTTPGKGECAWDYWLALLKDGMPKNASGASMPGIPVFIGHEFHAAASGGQKNSRPINPRDDQKARNDQLAALLKQLEGPAGRRKAAQDATLVYLSLSRFVKVPHKRSLRDVIESQDHVLDMRLDFARALFGQVPPEKIEAEVEGKPGRGALKGRVSFGEADLVAPRKVPSPLEKIGATLAPRASFWPYYLRPGGAVGTEPYDYSDSNSRIAGWKRYPVRAQAIGFTRDERTGGSPAPAGGSHSIEAKMRFLPATKECPLIFRGRIYLHNLKPAEIGALLWALTWGGVLSGERQPQRHQIGRGKPQGYGVCFCRVTKLDLETNIGEAPKSAAAYVSDFQTFVLGAWNASENEEKASAFASLPMIAPLLAMADPAIAEGLENRLVYPSVPKRVWQSGEYTTPRPAGNMSPDSSPSLEGYKNVKKAAALSTGRSVLPPYPRSR